MLNKFQRKCGEERVKLNNTKKKEWAWRGRHSLRGKRRVRSRNPRAGTDVKGNLLKAANNVGPKGRNSPIKRESPVNSPGLPSCSEVSAEVKDAYLRSARRESRTFFRTFSSAAKARRERLKTAVNVKEKQRKRFKYTS
ncbi:hypothetical protein NDU88_005751 [Pleurodeles waltl]|uniref:Uncharacterized protein n=1 Tax=Pleurodeles waltl TaxID=8319 RepID=A0AAV7MKD5_PLEWA|nr:hypothetical protein NDU88_005751 [Pleurodeles waltl]